MNVNPITRLDYPDLDVIRVEDTYYMVSTTMHFMPGCEILQSFDLVHRIFMRYVLVMLGSLVGLVIVAYLLLYLLISVGDRKSVV